jgi:hypothetical protein
MSKRRKRRELEKYGIHEHVKTAPAGEPEIEEETDIDEAAAPVVTGQLAAEPATAPAAPVGTAPAAEAAVRDQGSHHHRRRRRRHH